MRWQIAASAGLLVANYLPMRRPIRLWFCCAVLPMFAAACGSTPPRLDPYGRPHDEANSMKPIKLLACSPTGLDRQPRLLRGTRPMFPIGEDMAGRTGSAYVVFHVDVGGKVLLADRTAENRWFGSHAELALRDWQMEPAIKDGQPIRATCRLQFDFVTRGAMERLQIEKAQRP